MSDDLKVLFKAAHYRVSLDGGIHRLRIDAPLPEAIRRWLVYRAFAPCGWVITAHNPGGERIADRLNKARDTELRNWATRRPTAWLGTVNEDPDGRWPDEPGVMVAGIDEGEVRSVARRLGQAAIVRVPARDTVRLLWLEPRLPRE